MSARRCERCGGPIPPERARRSNARFCSDGCRKRGWAESLRGRGPCPVCGQPRGVGGRSGRCVRCRRRAEEAARAARAALYREWTLAGMTRRQMAVARGRSDGQVGVEMAKLRAAGYDIPYRYAGRRRAKGGSA